MGGSHASLATYTHFRAREQIYRPYWHPRAREGGAMTFSYHRTPEQSEARIKKNDAESRENDTVSISAGT